MNIENENNNLKEENVNNNQNVSNDGNNQTFIPSYMRSNDDSANLSSKKKKIKNKNNKNKRGVSVVWVFIFCIIVIILSIIFIPKIFNNIRAQRHTDYDEYMDKYGFLQLYDDKNFNNSDEVKKSELIKIILAASLKLDDDSVDLYIKNQNKNDAYIDEEGNLVFEAVDIAMEDENAEVDTNNDDSKKEEYKNQNWMIYAADMGLIKQDYITKDNYNDKATYKEAIELLGEAKIKLLVKELNTDVNPKFKDFDSYDESVQIALSDLVANHIIDDSEDKLNGDKKLTKKVFNELIIKYVNEYNLITENGDKINIVDEKKPSNEKDFPYTLASVDKSVYEIENYKENDNYKTPIECFSNIKSQYSSFGSIIDSYFSLILNINYENVNQDELEEKLIDLTDGRVSSKKINDYINFVKENKIQMTGSAKVQYPAIYFDGTNYRVRTLIEFNIESSNTLDNVLFADENSKYNLGKNSMYIDVPILKIDNGYYTVAISIDDMIAGKVKKIDQDKIQKQFEDPIIQVDESDNVESNENNSEDEVKDINEEDIVVDDVVE